MVLQQHQKHISVQVSIKFWSSPGVIALKNLSPAHRVSYVAVFTVSLISLDGVAP